MNREIKFRGKTPEGKWVYGSLVTGAFVESDTLADIPYIFNTNECDTADSFEDFTDNYGYYEVSPETVGQFTGLKDKNGTDIYEGDVISEYGNQYQVKFGDYQWSGCLVTGFYFSDEHPFGKCVSENTYEVIGSIHDKETEANHG